MAFGGHRGVALPCEIAVTQQGEDVEVVVLDPEAIFSVFFGDVSAEHAESMGGMAAAVRAELEDLVAEGLSGFQVETPFEDVGPELSEVCSPTCAQAALGAGAYHAPALPCQIAAWVEGDTLRVHVLDPMFIFPVFFADAPAEMMEQMGGLAGAVRVDIQLMVSAAQQSLATTP